MDETFLSWFEFEIVLRRLEARTGAPKLIQFQRNNANTPTEKEHHASARSHYRYKDFSILSARCVVE